MCVLVGKLGGPSNKNPVIIRDRPGKIDIHRHNQPTAHYLHLPRRPQHCTPASRLVDREVDFSRTFQDFAPRLRFYLTPYLASFLISSGLDPTHPSQNKKCLARAQTKATLHAVLDVGVGGAGLVDARLSHAKPRSRSSLRTMPGHFNDRDASPPWNSKNQDTPRPREEQGVPRASGVR